MYKGPWTGDEQQIMLAEMAARLSLNELVYSISSQTRRTPAAVLRRLKKIGYISSIPGGFLRANAKAGHIR